MSLHSSLSPKAIDNRIQRDQTPTAKIAASRRAQIIAIAQLTHAATIGQDPDAREQLRILRNITEEAQADYFQAVLG